MKNFLQTKIDKAFISQLCKSEMTQFLCCIAIVLACFFILPLFSFALDYLPWLFLLGPYTIPSILFFILFIYKVSDKQNGDNTHWFWKYHIDAAMLYLLWLILMMKIAHSYYHSNFVNYVVLFTTPLLISLLVLKIIKSKQFIPRILLILLTLIQVLTFFVALMPRF